MSISIGLEARGGWAEVLAPVPAVGTGRDPMNSGLSDSSSLSTIAAVPVVLVTGGPLLDDEPALARLLELVRDLLSDPGEGWGGGAKVPGLNVWAHSSAENFVPPGDDVAPSVPLDCWRISGSIFGYGDFVLIGGTRCFGGDRFLARLLELPRDG